MKININGITYPLEVMKTPEELEKGMMGRDSIEGGMLFILKKGVHKFWMKDCIIPLDIIFINNNRISHIHKNCPPCEGDCQKSYSGIGEYVVEFPSGTSNDFKIGDKVNLYLGTQQNPVISGI